MKIDSSKLKEKHFQELEKSIGRLENKTGTKNFRPKMQEIKKRRFFSESHQYSTQSPKKKKKGWALCPSPKKSNPKEVICFCFHLFLLVGG